MLAAPGAGKGLHSQRLSAATGVAHISSGELLRAEINRETALGNRLAEYTARGDLVPDELIFDVMVPVVVAAVNRTGGYLLDGFPRTMSQAVRAAQIGVELDLTSDAVIHLTAPADVLVTRLLDRAAQEGRADDTAQVIQHRLAVYEKQTKPLVDYYAERGTLAEADANRSVGEVQADIRSRLNLE